MPSKPWKLVFFKKEGCGPCDQALHNLNQALVLDDAFYGLVTVIEKLALSFSPKNGGMQR
jgi:hypothetical protein